MYFVVLGVILLFMKATDFGPVALWPWWAILWPWVAAVVWWFWADSTGYTKRREVDKMDERVAKRREDNLAHLGMDVKGRRKRRKT